MLYHLRTILIALTLGQPLLVAVAAADPPVINGLKTAEQMREAIKLKVPVGTPVAKAKEFMEGQGFKCSLCRQERWVGGDELLDFLYCSRTEREVRFVDRRWKVALICDGDKVQRIEVRTELVGP